MNLDINSWSLDNSVFNSGQISNIVYNKPSLIWRVSQIIIGVNTLTQSLGILKILSNKTNDISAIYLSAYDERWDLNIFFNNS